MLTANDNLARTHHAFEAWSANRRGPTRIPTDLLEKAVSLLDRHPITHVFFRHTRQDDTSTAQQ